MYRRLFLLHDRQAGCPEKHQHGSGLSLRPERSTLRPFRRQGEPAQLP